MPSLFGFLGWPFSLSSIHWGYQLKAGSLIAVNNLAVGAELDSFVSIDYWISQVSVKAVITVPYQLGEGKVVNYLIEKYGDELTSILN